MRRRLLALLVTPLVFLGALELSIRAHPYPRADLTRGFPESLQLLDRNDVALREVVNAQGERAKWMPLEEISPLVIEATLAVEDDRFARHAGVDWRAVARAVVADLHALRVVQGASTISMQLVRRVHPHPRDLVGKLGEMLQALRLERSFTKREILEQYLNRVPYGAASIGVEAASQRYFGKPSLHLSLAEAALLAGLPKGPTGLNPLRNPAAAKARQAVVLGRMLTTQRATPEDVERAHREPLVFASPTAPLAMHFTDWVRPAAGVGRVRTTLDLEVQREVEALVAEHVRALAPSGVTNAAVVVLDNERCEVRALVGSADYWDPRDGSVNGALSRRQPGSTLKPFTWALAYERGKGPNSVAADIETRYGEVGGALFTPQNYTQEFSGPVLFHDALGRSLNVPAIRIAAGLGTHDLLERLHGAGFASLDQPASHYGLGLTLGNGEVTLLELAQGYAMLARGGNSCTAVGVPGPSPLVTRVFSEEVAWLVTDAISDERSRMRAFGPNNALMLGFPVAVKTGTSTNWRDNWAVGFTPRFTVAVWAGDFGGRPLEQLAGASGAGPLFHRVMKAVALRGGQPRPIAGPVPPGIVAATVCATSGLKASPHCAERRSLHLLKDRLPTATCDHHQSLAIDTRNGLLAGPHCPSRFVTRRVFEVLPPAYASWQAEHSHRAPPSSFSPRCPARGPAPNQLVITWPRKNEVFVVEPGYQRRTQSVALAAEVEPRVAEVLWKIDGQIVAAASWPYNARWALSPGRHRLQAVAGHLRSAPIDFDVR